MINRNKHNTLIRIGCDTMLTKQEKTQLQKIQDLAQQMKSLYEDMNVDTQEFIRHLHKNETNLPNSISSIITNTDGLIEKTQTIYETGTNFTVKKDIDCGYGYAPKGSKAVLTQVYRHGLFSEDEGLYQFEFDTFISYNPEVKEDRWYEDLNVQDTRDHLQKD